MDNICRLLDTEGRGSMKLQHYAIMFLLLVVGYYVGTKYPAFWQKIGA